MSGITWHGAPPPPPPPMGPGGVLRAVGRGMALFLLISSFLPPLWALRGLERLAGRRLGATLIPHIVSRLALPILGIRHEVRGKPDRRAGAVVANHVSWLDIFTLNAADRIVFVAKAEVARWPFIGLMARSTGVVFIERRRSQAHRHRNLLAERIARGDRILFFPEGTSSDGLRVLPFRSTLFSAFFDQGFSRPPAIQPVTAIYHAPPGSDPRFYGWWGDMGFGPHLLQVLAARRQGRVEVIFHPAVEVADFADRKALAAHLERVVQRPIEEAFGKTAEEAATRAGMAEDVSSPAPAPVTVKRVASGGKG